MSPTSSGRQSPNKCIRSPSISPSAQEQELTHSFFSEKMQWTVKEGCFFPVYSKNENEKFRQEFNQLIKKISLQLKLTMACISEIFPERINSHWKAFSTLVFCLGNDLPKKIPLSIFTSAVVTACIANLDDSPPAKKRKSSSSSEDSDLRNKTLAQAQELASAISSTLAFVQDSLQLNQLKEKNPESDKTYHAFQSALSQRLDVECSVILDTCEHDLSKRIIFAIFPKGDTCSDEARAQLLNDSTREFLKLQQSVISKTYANLAHQNKPLPITGKSLLSVYKEHAVSGINVSVSLEWLPSWQESIFCYLARDFLQKKNVVVSHQINSQFLLGELKPFLLTLFPDCPSTSSSYEKKLYITDFLAQNFVRGNKGFPEIDPSIHYNEFLRCTSSIMNLFKGFFTLETGMSFSMQNLSNFQEYTQILHLPNATSEINNAIQEVYLLCSEELQQNFSYTRLLLEETNTLLEQLLFQSFAIAALRKKGFNRKSAKQNVKCEWMPEEFYLSTPFLNYWIEAKWAYNSKKLLTEKFPKTIVALGKTLTIASSQLKITFRRLCYNLLADVLEEKPLEVPENPLYRFLATARSFQTKEIPQHGPTSHLFTIAMNFIAKSEKPQIANTFLLLASQDFQKAQVDFLTYTYKFFLQNKCPIITTKIALLEYCKSQYKETVNVPPLLEKFPFWKDCIFLCLATMFLQKKQVLITVQSGQEPIFVQDRVVSVTKMLAQYFTNLAPAKMLMSNQRNLLIQQLAETLPSMNFEPMRDSEKTSPAGTIYESKAYEFFFHTATSFNKLLQAFFTLNTGMLFSSNNLRAFHEYTNVVLSHTKNSYTQKMVSRALAISMANTRAVDEPQKETIQTVEKISTLLKNLIEEAVTIFILRKKKYKHLIPKIVIQKAFSIICSAICVPDTLLLPKKINIFLKQVIQNFTEKPEWEQNPNQFEYTSKMYSKTAIELTSCFLKICQKLLLEAAAKQSPATQKFIETASLICPRIILESHQNQCILENIASFISGDIAHTNTTKILPLAINNFFKAQENFLQFAYSYFIKYKLSLPLTGTDLLAFFKKQYQGTTVIDRPLATLTSWHNLIFYSLACIFLIKKRKNIGVDAHPWNTQVLVNIIASFFPQVAKEITGVSQETKLKKFTQCLAEYFNSVHIHNIGPQTTEIDPHVCKAYENLLQSTLLLKELCRSCFTIKTDNDSSSQDLAAINEYINLLLVNEPTHRKTSTLKDVLIICSEETVLPTIQLSQLCTSLDHASSLINNIMKVSLALVMLKGNAETELTPQQTVESALKVTSSPVSLDVVTKAFLNSPSGINALQVAITEYLSGNLCIQMFEQFKLFSQETAANPLQTTIDAHLSRQRCPQIIKYMQLLSSKLLSKTEALTSLCKKLCIDMKASVTSAMHEDVSEATSSRKFMITANNCYDKMTFEEHTTRPLFRALVLILAEECADELQKNSNMPMQPSAETSPIETETNVAIWQETRDVLLTEEEETFTRPESHISTVPQQTEKSLEELWSTIENILSKKDYTSLLEKTEEFENLPEQKIVQFETTHVPDLLKQFEGFTDSLEQEASQIEVEDFTDFLEQTKECVDLLDQKFDYIEADDFMAFLGQIESFGDSLEQEATEIEEEMQEEHAS